MSTTTILRPSTPTATPVGSSLRARATSLRTQADSLRAPLAAAYRRRASELELEAWLDELVATAADGEMPPAA